MPFLVDSVTMEVNRHGLTLHLIIHPIVAVVRDADGTLAGVADDAEGAQRESLIHVEVDRIVDPAKLDELAADVVRVLDDVRAAVEDWKKMRERVGAILAENEKRRAAAAAGRARRGQGVPVVARRRSLHFSRLSPPRARRRSAARMR